MSRGSIRYIDRTYIYGQHAMVTPVSNPVIYAHFPKNQVKTAKSDKINKILSMILLCLVAISAVSYYFVSDGERKMNSIGREIVALTNENIELQNKIDNLHSFNKIETIIQNKAMLDTAKNVIEIPTVKSDLVSSKKKQRDTYRWSIGY